MLFFTKKTKPKKSTANKKTKKDPTTHKVVIKSKSKSKAKAKGKKPQAIAIKKYTNDSQKPHKDYNSIDVEWLEKKLQNTNKKRVQMLATDHREATVKFVKMLLKSDKKY